jgi:hypothetical protein
MKKAILFLLFFAIIFSTVPAVYAANTISGIQIFPSDYVWNVPVNTLSVHPNSSSYIAAEYGSAGMLIPAFGYGATGNGAVGGGYAYDIINRSVAKSTVIFAYPSSSFQNLYPIPLPYPSISGAGTDGTCDTNAKDCHAILIDKDSKLVYELFGVSGNRASNGAWMAGSGAVWNLSDYSIANRGTANAAGTPMIAGMIRYDEVASGSINHAIGLAIPYTRYGYTNYTWPARQGNSIYVNNWSTNYPRMGERFRLKASFDISKYSPRTRLYSQP